MLTVIREHVLTKYLQLLGNIKYNTVASVKADLFLKISNMLYWTLIFLTACLGLMEASLLLGLVPGVGGTLLVPTALLNIKEEMPTSCFSRFSRS